MGRLATVAHTSQTVTSIFAGTVLKCSQGFEGGPGNMEMVSTQAKRIEVLKKKSVAAIKQVTILVGELRHMALLWDELRPGILILYSSEGKRQIRRFQEKAAKLAGKKSFSVQVERDLLVTKNNIIFAGNLYELDQVAAISRAAPETPHNEQVQRKNRKFSSTLLDRFRNPADLAASSKSWTPLRQLQQQLVARADKRNFTLKFSPSLHTFRDKDITMIGLSMLSGLVARFDTTMYILPFKAKPKQLRDNGQTYLSMGLEDLHLDKRIMQFLFIVYRVVSGYKIVAVVGGYSARLEMMTYYLCQPHSIGLWIEGKIHLIQQLLELF